MRPPKAWWRKTAAGGVRKAGLNRARIRDALYSFHTFPDVTGEIVFDRTMNDISRPWLATVESGRFRYFRPPDWERQKRFSVIIAERSQPE